MTKDINKELIEATRNSDISAIKSSLRKGANVNYQTREGITPLMLASSSGDIEIVSFLLKKKANPMIKSLNGFDAFYRAHTKGQKEIANILANAQKNILKAIENKRFPKNIELYR